MWEYIKLKNFCAIKGIINRVKKQPRKWEKIFVNHTLSFKSTVYKELVQPPLNKDNTRAQLKSEQRADIDNFLEIYN